MIDPAEKPSRGGTGSGPSFIAAATGPPEPDSTPGSSPGGVLFSAICSKYAPGEVAEWSIAPHSKCGIRATVSGVQIPPSPPLLLKSLYYFEPF
jgi:hypothetical protein